jgi:Sulfotransferase family
MPSGEDDVKVLFLAGKGRSGGTLLANLLGQLPGFFNAGELSHLWDSGLVHNRLCGCGLAVQDCPTWNAILAAADSLPVARSIAPLATARIDLAQAAVVRWPHLVRLFRSRVDTRSRWDQLERYTDAASAVYRGIAGVTGARVVVDSSRTAFEPAALGLVPGVDVRVVHVVRDPRAVVYSWQRSREWTDRPTGEYLERRGAAFSTASWIARNLAVEILRPRHRPILRVQYDAMARDPAAILREVAAFAGEPAGELEFLTSDAATIVPTHSVGGNPMRMTSGQIAIRPDEEWREGLTRRDRITSTAIALPLLHRYGLPVRI